MDIVDINKAILNDLEEEFLNADIAHFRDEWDHYKYNKQYIPRVTHIIHSCQLDSDSLVIWANKMGKMHKDSQEIKENAAILGTYIHEMLEKYINSGIEPDIMAMDIADNFKRKMIVALEGFKAFWEGYRYKDLVESVTTEKTILTPYFGGTYDLMVNLKDGRHYLYDFKTTNSLRDSQFIQLAAYNFGLRNYYNTNLSGVAILKIDKYRPSCKEYMIDFSIPSNISFIDQCERTFIAMMYSYYNMKLTKMYFDDYLETRR